LETNLEEEQNQVDASITLTIFFGTFNKKDEVCRRFLYARLPWKDAD